MFGFRKKKDKKTFNGYSRQMRRNARITVDGKEWKVLKYMEHIAPQLPPLEDKKCKKVNHLKMLKKAYMEGGPDAIKQYVNDVRTIYKRDAKKVLGKLKTAKRLIEIHNESARSNKKK